MGAKETEGEGVKERERTIGSKREIGHQGG